MQSFPFIHWWSIKVIIFSGGEDIRNFCLVGIVVMSAWWWALCKSGSFLSMTSWWALELCLLSCSASPVEQQPSGDSDGPSPVSFSQSMLWLFPQALGLGSRWTLLWLMCFLVSGVIVYPWLPGTICWDFSMFNLCKSPRITCVRWAAL